jgi:hypothetical protein
LKLLDGLQSTTDDKTYRIRANHTLAQLIDIGVFANAVK